MRAFSQYGAIESADAALRMRQACALIFSIVDEPERRAISAACSALMAGPWTTRFMRQESGTDHVFLSCNGPRQSAKRGLSLFSGGELKEDVLHRLGALLPGGQLGIDAQALRAREARGAAFLADELEHLAAVERRIFHELQLHRLVRGVDARDAERPRGEAYLVALDEGARRLGQLAEAVDPLLAHRFERLARLGVGWPFVDRQSLVHVAAIGLRQQGWNVQVDFGGNVDDVIDIRRLAGLEPPHRAFQHPGVQREPNFLDFARLRFAEDLAGAADLEVVNRGL